MSSEDTIVMGEGWYLNDSAPTSNLTPKNKGKYKFSNSIATGGMKVILKVKDIDTDRYIAMASLLHSDPSDSEVLQFVREARINAMLEHPNIVPVHEIGKDENDLPYFTMKLINGKTLHDVIELLKNDVSRYRYKYKLDYLLNVMIKVCDAIAFSHSKGIIHLDLKPENILLGRFAEVLVLDWGLAKPVKEYDFETGSNDSSARISQICGNTMNGITKGTPRFMSPEQAAGKNDARDERSDIYSLGAIIYSMMTWEFPIEGESIKQILANTIYGKVTRPRKRARERKIPKAMEGIIMKAMALKPEDRYQSVKALRRDILLFRQSRATSIERSSLIKRLVLLPRRNVPASVFAILFIITLALFITTVTG